MTPEQRQELIRLLEQGEEISPEWARILFPPEKREYELNIAAAVRACGRKETRTLRLLGIALA